MKWKQEKIMKVQLKLMVGDLTDYNSKRLIYQLLEKHSKEMNPKMKSLLLYNSGGRCNDIIKLDNTQVKLFHDEFYHYDNITVLILGQDLNLNEFDWDLNQTRNETLQTNIELIQNNFELNHRDWTLINHFDPSQKNILETFPKLSEYHITHFPSTETKFASITMNWILPADTTDYFQQLETAFAVDILWKCLYETTASILNHAFVSRREFGSLNINEELEPFADDVCAAVSCGTWSNEWCGIAELVFSGISLETNPLIESIN